jgi:uncharacterized protein (TIGR02598 family)
MKQHVIQVGSRDIENRPSLVDSDPVSACRCHRGFSLVEITLTLGIIATAVLGVMALIPIAVSASKEATEETTVSLVMENVRSHLRGIQVPLGSTTKFFHGSYYFDQQGQLVHFEPAAGATTFGVPSATDLQAPAPSAGLEVVVTNDAAMRADVTIIPVGAYDASNVPAGGLAGSVTVIMEFYAPINLGNGAPLPSGAAPLRTIPFTMSRLTDSGWEMYQSGYQPRLEI